jgi:uncharacterized membrane protein
VKQIPIAQSGAAAGQFPPSQISLVAGVSAMSHVFLIATIITGISILLVFLMPLKSIAQKMKAERANLAQDQKGKEASESPVPVMEA